MEEDFMNQKVAVVSSTIAIFTGLFAREAAAIPWTQITGLPATSGGAASIAVSGNANNLSPYVLVNGNDNNVYGYNYPTSGAWEEFALPPGSVGALQVSYGLDIPYMLDWNSNIWAWWGRSDLPPTQLTFYPGLPSNSFVTGNDSECASSIAGGTYYPWATPCGNGQVYQCAGPAPYYNGCDTYPAEGQSWTDMWQNADGFASGLGVSVYDSTAWVGSAAQSGVVGSLYQWGGTCSQDTGCTGSGWTKISYPFQSVGALMQGISPFYKNRAIVLEYAMAGSGPGFVVWEYNNGTWTNLTSTTGVYANQVAVGFDFSNYTLTNAVWSVDFYGNVFQWQCTGSASFC
jgi:hypothetical protein